MDTGIEQCFLCNANILRSGSVKVTAKGTARNGKASRERNDLKKKFFRSPTDIPKGRHELQAVNSAMEKIYETLEESDGCQFSFKQLSNNLTYIPTTSTIWKKLLDKHDEDVVITVDHQRQPVVSFRLTANKLPTEWVYSERKTGTKERIKVVLATAAIIREGIESQISVLQLNIT